MNKVSIPNFSFLCSLEVTQIYLSGWVAGWVGGWVGGPTVIIGLVSVQVELKLDLLTGTELGKIEVECRVLRVCLPSKFPKNVWQYENFISED